MLVPSLSKKKKKKRHFFLPVGIAFTKTCAEKCSCLAGVSPAWEKEAVEEEFGEKHLKSQDNTTLSTSGSTGTRVEVSCHLSRHRAILSWVTTSG